MIWKEAVVAYFKAPSRYSSQETEKNTKNIHQDSSAEKGNG
jgi:hypothetical protein